jgi:hypothetical protein
MGRRHLRRRDAPTLWCFWTTGEICGWHKLFEQRGEGLTTFDVGGSAGFSSSAQEEDALKAFVSVTLPRSTRQVGAFIERGFGPVYESRSGLIALLHRLGLEYHKRNVIARKLDVAEQTAFIESHNKLLNSLGNDEAVLYVDPVHPTHAARPFGCYGASCIDTSPKQNLRKLRPIRRYGARFSTPKKLLCVLDRQ